MNPDKRAFVALCGIVVLSSVLLWASPAAARELPLKGRIDGTFVATPTGEFVFIAEGSFEFVNEAVHGTYTETFEGTISY